MPTQAAFGNRIAQARNQKGYSPKDAARLTGVTEKTIKKWEAGKSAPRGNRVQMLAGILGVPLMWLLEGGDHFEQEGTNQRQLEKLSLKVERMAELQQELMTLSSQVASEVEELQKIENEANL